MMVASPTRHASSEAHAVKFCGRSLRGAAASIQGSWGSRRRVAKLWRLGLEEPDNRLGGGKPLAGETRGFQADTLAAGTAYTLRDPRDQTTQRNGLALAMRRETPARARERHTVAGGDLLVDRAHFATSRSVRRDLGLGL
jgi:hypothetical protein